MIHYRGLEIKSPAAIGKDIGYDNILLQQYSRAYEVADMLQGENISLKQEVDRLKSENDFLILTFGGIYE